MSQNTKNKRQELVNLDKSHFMHPTASPSLLQKEGPPFIFEEGNGVYLKDIEGNSYLDSLSCLWNVNIGHGRKEIGDVAKEQIGKLAFSSAHSNWSHEPVIRLATKIASLTPDNLNTVFFTSGGSEANDTAFKTVRHYWKIQNKPQKKKIISRTKSYHGVAMGSTSATGIPEFNKFTESIAPDFLHIGDTIDELKNLIKKEGAETIAAFISEPIQGSGGVIFPTKEYFKEVKKICEENSILFIADEVITGFGRTGKMFGMEHFSVIPDVMTVAKGLTSGYAPLGGMIISDSIYSSIAEKTEEKFWHGYTYSGHPVVSQIALKNIQIIEEERLVERVSTIGEVMLNELRSLQEKYEDIIIETRGIGLLGAIEFKSTFSSPLSPEIVKEAVKRNMIGRAITYGGQDTLAFAPPFIITEEEIKKMINIVDQSIAAIKS